MRKTIIIFFLMAIILYSCKKDDTVETNNLNGDYFGMLTSNLYVSMNGQTTIDTIDSNLKINLIYQESDKTLLLFSPNSIFDSITLNELEITDSTNGHYGNDKVFEFTNIGSDWRYYYLHYNLVHGKDSVYINSYLPPCCGWNRSEVYIGIK